MFYNNVIIAHVNYYFILLKTIYFKVDLEISNKPKIWWILTHFFQLLLLKQKPCQYIFRQYISIQIIITCLNILKLLFQ